MCQFFSFCTDEYGKKYYFDWEYRKKHLKDDPCPNDSHTGIAKEFNKIEDKLNKFEYNPLTKEFMVDQINCVDNRIQAEAWVKKLDFGLIVPQLIIKPIVNPLLLSKVTKVTKEQIKLLKNWDSVRDSIRDSVLDSIRDSVRDSIRDSVWDSVRDSVLDSIRDSVWDSIRDSIRDSVLDSVRDSVWDSVLDSVWDSVYAYMSSFFDIKYKCDFSSAIQLWESGLIPSFDGKTWRLRSGKKADIIYEWTPE